MPQQRIRLRRSWRVDLADRLYAARLLARLRQSDLARALGKSQCVVSRVESGHTLPTLATVLKWGKACGVNPAQFLEGML